MPPLRPFLRLYPSLVPTQLHLISLTGYSQLSPPPIAPLYYLFAPLTLHCPILPLLAPHTPHPFTAMSQWYLDLLETGAFAKFSPARLQELYSQLKHYLLASANILDATTLFDLYQLMFYVLLLTEHDLEAKLYLDRIRDQFSGKKSQKFAVLRLMYHEALGETALAKEVLGNDSDQLQASRRRAVLAHRSGDGSGGVNVPAYVESLNLYLDLQPSDAMAWAELGDVYQSVGEYSHAVYCYKEVLLQHPTAYNFFYKAGLSSYYQHLLIVRGDTPRKEMLLRGMELLQHARDCFLRAVEISESYTRGWVGVYFMCTAEFLATLLADKASAGVVAVQTFLSQTERVAALSRSRIQQLEELQTADDFERFVKS